MKPLQPLKSDALPHTFTQACSANWRLYFPKWAKKRHVTHVEAHTHTHTSTCCRI